MMKTSVVPPMLALALVLPVCHGAQQDALLSTLKRVYPNTTFDAVRRSEIPGLYEVRMGSNVAYVSASRPRYFLFGHLYDASAGKDLTESRHATPSIPAPHSGVPKTTDTATLPLADAIKSTSGTGEKILVVFTDPACPYCQRLDAELAKLPDTTVYNFMLPFLGEALPQAVWCASDRQLAWQAALRGQLSAGGTSPCANPIARNRALATRLGIVGTPTLIFPSGERLEGYATADDIAPHFSAHAIATATATGKE
ncbi:DsbC family protein [Duganella vulcania]|uniref:Thiol:disulfide interchange protein n=1 Tax=Duganella vulcania TaxID=2692166 RepID=A0A845GPJ3_9BURK|nr:DsbC family protein [Duganella vulcania]MYM95921.1 thioredoxin fold domain-containing protein [Duganella vulcania]